MKKYFITLLAMVLSLSASAQSDSYVEAPYGFVGIQGGAQSILLKQNRGDLKVSPTAAVSVGAMINPYLGARFNFQGIWNKFEADKRDIDFKSVTGDFDLLLNVTNFFRAEKYKPFNLYLIGGAGVIGTWDEPDNLVDRQVMQDWYNFRGGVMADYRLTENLSANLEVNGNYMGGVKSEIYGDNKWKVNVLLGLAYRIPFADDFFTPVSKKSSKVDAPVTSNSDYDAAAAAAEAARLEAARKAKAEETARIAKAEAERKVAATAAAAAAEIKPIDETIFFSIGQYASARDFSTIVKAAADWCKSHPEKTIEVKGYADKGTGSAAVNKRIAERRAAAVADAIKAHGVPADQLSISSYGDKVQPFAENDKNRCVIIAGK